MTQGEINALLRDVGRIASALEKIAAAQPSTTRAHSSKPVGT